MSDLISRSDAIEALCHNCAYYTDAQCKTDSGYWCESGAMIREDIPSAETHDKRTETHGVCSDLISRADAICEVLVNDGIENIVDRINKLPSADAVDVNDVTIHYKPYPSAEAEPKWNCTANFVAEQLDRLRNMTDEERWDFFIKFFSPSADTVSREFYNDAVKANIRILMENKELKEQIESTEAVTIHEDGTLEVKVSNAHKVGRVLVTDTESHIGGGLFYPDDAEADWIPCSERLPKAEDMYQIPEQRYLCQLEAHGERKFCVLSRLKGAVSPFWDWYGIAVYDSDVIAWMPLPDPYREDGEV